MKQTRTVPQIIAVPTLVAARKLLFPFWFSPRNWLAWVILAAMFGVTTLATYFQYQMTAWMNRFMTAFTTYDFAGFPALVGMFLAFGLVLAVIAIGERCLHGALRILWKTSMTHAFLKSWLGDDAYYRIERDKLLDNPDQRIAEDIDLFISTTLMLTVGLYGTVIRVGTFSYNLWRIGGDLTLSSVTIPGYMVWCAFLVAGAQLGLLHLAGRSLMHLNFQKQQVEGNFRFSMASVRTSAEEIATYRGGGTEFKRISGIFETVRANMWRLLFVEMRFSGLRTFMENLASPLPLLLMAPKYFSKQITFGDVAQVGAMFGTVVSGLLWFAQNYESLQVFRVVVARLHGIESLTRPHEPRAGEEVDYQEGSDEGLVVDGLVLTTPGGRPLGPPVQMQVEARERWIVQGPTGVGKSTFLRALAGIWPYGRGSIRAPHRLRSLFIPQRSYIPAGTLAEALCYPHPAGSFTHAQCTKALELVALSPLVDQLDTVDRWAQRLSLGEQQRVALARAVLHQPEFLLMDEATSALDEDTEQLVYGRLLRSLPDSAVVHVAHHISLVPFHNKILRMRGLDACEPVRSAGLVPA